MRIKELYEVAKKLMEQGHGDAYLVHTDTRSGVSELCHLSSHVEVVDGTEQDFYADLDTGDKYVNVYEGGI